MARSARAARELKGSPPAITVAATVLVHTVGRFETRPSLSSVPSGTARKVAALISKILQHERKLAGDVVRLRSCLQLSRQHVPGVGLDLEVRRQRLGAKRRESRTELALRR